MTAALEAPPRPWAVQVIYRLAGREYARTVRLEDGAAARLFVGRVRLGLETPEGAQDVDVVVLHPRPWRPE